MRTSLVLAGWTAVPATTTMGQAGPVRSFTPENMQTLADALQRASNPLTLFESDSQLQTRLTEMLAREGGNIDREIGPEQRTGGLHTSGEYPIVPAGSGSKPPEKEDFDIPGPMTLAQVNILLDRVRMKLSDVPLVREVLQTKFTEDMSKLGEQIMAIPFKNVLAVEEQKNRAWQRALEIVAALLHLLGRRLLAEKEYEMAMEYFTQAMVHYTALDDSAYIGWIDGICVDMDKVPQEVLPPLAREKPEGLPMWDLQEAFREYRHEFMSASGRYVFIPPPYVSEPVSQTRVSQTRVSQTPLLRSFSVTTGRPYIPEPGTVISKRFEVYWNRMPLTQRFLLHRPLGRIRQSGNHYAAGLLDAIAWNASRKLFDPTFVHRWITKAIYALDTVLREDETLQLARMTIDGHIFTYGGALGHAKDFVLFADEDHLPKEAKGVQVYFIFSGPV